MVCRCSELLMVFSRFAVLLLSCPHRYHDHGTHATVTYYPNRSYSGKAIISSILPLQLSTQAFAVRSLTSSAQVEGLRKSNMKTEKRVKEISEKLLSVEEDIKTIRIRALEGKIPFEYVRDLLQPLNSKQEFLQEEHRRLEVELRIGEISSHPNSIYCGLSQKTAKYLYTSQEWSSKDAPEMSSKVCNISDFEGYRSQGYYFVDKTRFIQPLLRDQRVIFRRPRRFGKSLTLSMLKAFFYGAPGLFHGLDVYQSDFKVGKFVWCPSSPAKHNFPPCPVIHLDFSFDKCRTVEEFDEVLSRQLLRQARVCGLSDFTVREGVSPSSLLSELLAALSWDPFNKWKKAVILIDECDYPVRNALVHHQSKMHDSMTTFLRTIKLEDEFIQFAYITGIQSHVMAGIYSGANNFIDFTFKEKYENLCGYSAEEARAMLDRFELTPDDETFLLLRKEFNGYSFSEEPDSPDKPRDTLFNPFSINQYARNRKVEDYWMGTASLTLAVDFPTFAPFMTPTSCPLYQLKYPLNLATYQLPEYLGRNLVEAGYFTIKSVKDAEVIFGYPNEQIKRCLESNYYQVHQDLEPKFTTAVTDLQNGDISTCLKLVNLQLIRIPYALRKANQSEDSWHSTFSDMLNYAGISHFRNQGQVDLVMTLQNVMYLVKFKLAKKETDDFNKIAEDAIGQQIITKSDQYISCVQDHQAQGKKVILVALIALYHVPSRDTDNSKEKKEDQERKDEKVKIGWCKLRYYDPNSQETKDVDLEIPDTMLGTPDKTEEKRYP